MNRKTILGIAILILSITGSLFAFDDDCKNNKDWYGSFTNAVVLGEGDAAATYVEQLQLLADGTAILYASYYLETPVLGSSTPGYGRWTCRDDGKIAATVLFGNFGPYPPEVGGIGPTLHYHVRATQLFSISGPDSITAQSTAYRVYPRGDDPTDANGGILLPPSQTPKIWTRLKVGEADLDQ